jgi:hypothetical protein
MAGSETQLNLADNGEAAYAAAGNFLHIIAGGGVAEGGGVASACRARVWGNPVIGPASR